MTTFEQLPTKVKKFIEEARENGCEWSAIADALGECLAQAGFTDEDEKAVEAGWQFASEQADETSARVSSYHNLLGDEATEFDCDRYESYLIKDGWTLEAGDDGQVRAFHNGQPMTEEEWQASLEEAFGEEK